MIKFQCKGRAVMETALGSKQQLGDNKLRLTLMSKIVITLVKMNNTIMLYIRDGPL